MTTRFRGHCHWRILIAGHSGVEVQGPHGQIALRQCPLLRECPRLECAPRLPQRVVAGLPGTPQRWMCRTPWSPWITSTIRWTTTSCGHEQEDTGHNGGKGTMNNSGDHDVMTGMTVARVTTVARARARARAPATCLHRARARARSPARPRAGTRARLSSSGHTGSDDLRRT